MSTYEILSDLIDLIRDASIDFGIIGGTGLGAVLLTVVAIFYLSRNRVTSGSLVSLFRALNSVNKLEKHSSKKDGDPPEV